MSPPTGGTERLKIFINYRHADTGWVAWALYFNLEARFGADSIFFDKGSLRGGMQWLDEIKSGLAEAGVLLALIGPKWMSKLQANLQMGGDDFVVKEIESRCGANRESRSSLS